MQAVAGETVKFGRSAMRKIRAIPVRMSPRSTLPATRHWRIPLENRCFPASSAELGRCLTSGLPTPQGSAVRASTTSALDACLVGIALAGAAGDELIAKLWRN